MGPKGCGMWVSADVGVWVETEFQGKEGRTVLTLGTGPMLRFPRTREFNVRPDQNLFGQQVLRIGRRLERLRHVSSAQDDAGWC